MSIFGFIKKYKFEIILLTLIVVAYFSTRFFRIMSLPIFTDEAIYVRWSQIARADANWRFISLTDGKQPSFVWIAMSIMKFVKDPLLAARLVSVFAGFGSLIGMFFVGREIFKNRWIGILSSFVYLVFPMALVYDRMALYDSLVGMFAIWALYFSILLVRNVRLDIALILGMVMGGGFLTKSSLFFSLPLLFASYILFDWKQKYTKEKIFKLIGLSIVAGIVSFGMYSILRLSPFYHIINEKNSIFAYPINEWIKHPFTYFSSNLRGLFDWLITYLTPALVLTAVFSFLIPGKLSKRQWKDIFIVFIPFGLIILVLNLLNFVGALTVKTIEIQTVLPYVFAILLLACAVLSLFRRYDFWREKAVLFVWFGVPFIYLAFFGNTIYPRFILFMVLFLIPLVAFSLYNLRELFANKIILAFLFIVLFGMALNADFWILKDISLAPIPRSDYDQYINNWPAGGGVKEIISYLDEQAKNQKIYIASLGTFGSLPTYSVEIYLGENTNISKEGIYPVPSEMPQELGEKAKQMPTYLFVSNQKEFEEAIKNWPLTLVVEYQKGSLKKAYSRLYKINPR